MWVFLRVASFLLISLLGVPARAWTHTHVDQAHIEAEALADGRTRVHVALALRVDGGWLEGLELPGFDGVVALDPETPASITAADGRVYVPTETLSALGNLSLAFSRRQAPRRGEYTLRFAYFAEPAASAEAQGLRLGFSLPGFESGLERASVALDVPSGAEAVIDPDLALAPRVERTSTRTRITFERLHVPRSTPWTVQVAIPHRPPPATARASLVFAREPWTGVVLALVVVLLGHAARARRRRRREQAGAFSIALARLPRGAAELSALVGACWWTWSLEAALLSWLSTSIALALLPGSRDALRVPFGRLVPVPRDAHRRAALAARRAAWGLDAPFDATTVLGALLLAGLLLVPSAFAGAYAVDGAGWGLGLLCAVPAWFAGTRLDAEPDSFAQLEGLRALAGALDVQGWAASLRWVETRQGPRGVRLALSSAARLTGVWSVEVQLNEAAGSAPRLRLCVDPPVEAALVQKWGERVVLRADGVGGRRILLIAEHDIARVLGSLNVSAAVRARAFLRTVPPPHLADQGPTTRSA